MSTLIPPNGARFTSAEIAAILGVDALGPEVQIEGIRTDSRTIAGGDCFLALKGERFDGHDYLDEAVRKGARALIIGAQFDGALPQGVAIFRVADPLYALGELARAHRARSKNLRVIGITGSAGKTGTKELLGALIREAAWPALITQGNLNNRIGLPMMLLTLEDEQLAILEMGTSEPGEIARLAEIARPDIGIITLIDASHTEGLGGVEGVVNEKDALFRALGEEGWAIGCADEAHLARLLDETPAHVLRYGKGANVDLRILEYRFSSSGTSVLFERKGERFRLETPLLGEPAVHQLAIAALVAELLGMDEDCLARAAATARPRPGRLSLLQKDELLLIDDTYNANPRSMRAALELAVALSHERGGRAFALLGDMRELGSLEKSAHREVLSTQGIDLFLVGSAFKEARSGNDFPAYDSPMEAAEALKKRLKPRDLVLLKGSRSMGMERAIPILLGGEKERVGR